MLVDEGWYTDDQLWIEVKNTIGVWYKIKLIGSRNLLNTYDRIALTYMTHVTKQFGVTMNESKVKIMTEINDAFIIKVHDQLKNYINPIQFKCNISMSYIKMTLTLIPSTFARLILFYY